MFVSDYVVYTVSDVSFTTFTFAFLQCA